MRKIVFASQKGGSAKTTTATALARGLARRGKRALLVDLDAQANASWTLAGGHVPDPPTVAEVLLKLAAPRDAIRRVSAGLELLPASAALSGVNVALVQEVGRDARLRSALAPCDGRWDVVIIDTAPTFTTLLANALVYAAEVIVPVDASMYAMLGLVQLQETIEEVRDAYGNRELRLAGLVLTRVARNNVCRDVEAELRARFGGLVYRATIPLSSKVEEAHTRGQTVLEYAPKSPAGLAYEALVEEVLNDGQREEQGGGSAPVGGPGALDAA